MTRVVVVGGGITGLAAALELARLAPGAEVVLREAGTRLGGHLHSTPFAGRPAIDEAADAFLARVPHAAGLARSVGLGDDLASPATGSAAIWHGRLHPIPDGIVLGVPGNVRAMTTSRLLSWRGKARAGLDVLLPRRDPRDSVGSLIRGRFGAEVHDRLVDALVGSIYAADTDRFSLDMVPQLAALASTRRSLLGAAYAARRAQPASGDPVFLAPRAGMSSLIDTVAGAAKDAGVQIEAGAPVNEIVRSGRSGSGNGGGSDPRHDHSEAASRRRTVWEVDGSEADGVVVAAPARAAATMLSSDRDLAALLGQIETAGVALVTMAVPADDWPASLRGRSGYLVPKSVQRRVTAVSFGSQKWEHWAQDGSEVLRVSIGRDGAPFDDLDDERLVATAVDEVSVHLGVALQPVATRVSRWPVAFPQYRPGHQRWLAEVERHTPPGLTLAGASYRGIGIPACVDQGQQAARNLAGALGMLPAWQP